MSFKIYGRDTVEIEDDELPELGVTFGTLAEDQVLMRFAKHLPRERWFYVDAGAYDPIKNSNTLLLFKRGWRGINIDGNTAAIARFNQKRPHDINVHAYLSDKPAELVFAEYDSITTNRLLTPGRSPKSYKGETPLRTTRVQTQTLASILDRHMAPHDAIGYLNIDCEGQDLEVLIGSDVDRWRPSIISIEGNTPAEQSRAYEYLTQHNYELRANVIVTQIFTDRGCEVMDKALRYKLED